MKFENISITADGTWLHGGVEITHEKTIALFKRSVYFKNGKYFLSGEKVPVPVDVADVAFFVTSITRKQNDYWLSLSDGSEEKLDCTTLDQHDNNALYCLLKTKSVPAKFERKAYHDLMKDLTTRDGYYGLVVENLFYPIQAIAKPKPVETKATPAKPTPAVKKPSSKQPAKSKPKPKSSKAASGKSKPAPKKKPTKKPTKKAPAKKTAARAKPKRK